MVKILMAEEKLSPLPLSLYSEEEIKQRLQDLEDKLMRTKMSYKDRQAQLTKYETQLRNGWRKSMAAD